MGFLNNVTNNIILDAVLTDEGRKRLAQNDRSFTITQFCLGDDEVDYTIIKKYGRAVGKEKIEKNTPILEALTQGNAALRSPLVSAGSPTLTRMPTIKFVRATTPYSIPPALSGHQGPTGLVNMSRYGSAASTQVTFETMNAGTDAAAPDIPPELSDSQMIVTLDESILTLVGATPISVDSSGVARYRLSSSAGPGGKRGITLRIAVKPVSDEIFNSYLVSGETTMTKYLSITGFFSGAHTSLAFKISNSG